MKIDNEVTKFLDKFQSELDKKLPKELHEKAKILFITRLKLHVDNEIKATS